MALWMEVDARSGVPIYVQLVEGVRRALEVGTLESGERLPTVRGLAGELGIAPNTVVKAYNELQRMGLIESWPGVGTIVVARSGEAVREQQLEAFYERFGSLVRDAVGSGSRRTSSGSGSTRSSSASTAGQSARRRTRDMLDCYRGAAAVPLQDSLRSETASSMCHRCTLYCVSV